jgi:hypothetical protein
MKMNMRANVKLDMNMNMNAQKSAEMNPKSKHMNGALDPILQWAAAH